MSRLTEPLVAAGAEGAWCVMLSDGDAVTSIDMAPGRRVVIGRGDDADVTIDDGAVSRRHLALESSASGDELRLTDLGSRNGTSVAQRAITPRVPIVLVEGDVIRFGHSLAIVQRREPARRAAPSGLHGALRQIGATAQPFGYLLVEGGDEPAIAALLRAGDTVAAAAPSLPALHEVILPGAHRAQAAAIRDRLAGQLGVRVGVATRPWDGNGWEAIAARAWATLRAPADDPMQAVRDLIERIAPSDLSVLLLGETGAGKEVCAEMLHRWSRRAERPLLRLHCASLRDSLFESELFGHERGAFTGAVAAKPGLLETADGGTVFLDEVGDLPLEMQVKLLRVIEERAVLRVGALRPRHIDVRFVAATHRPLERDVAEGRFRQDLFFRLAAMTIELPPLRARRHEIAGLARVFAVAAAHAAGRARAPELTDDAIAALEAAAWPGNVRELRHTIERVVTLAGDEPIDAAAFGDLASERLRPARTTTRPLRAEVAEVERERILAVLEACGGNQTRAAAELGISRSTLNARLDAYQVKRPRKRT